MRCVVLGGGITGLALAHELVRRGVEPLLFESEHRVGGKIRSDRAAGFLLESGPAALLGGPGRAGGMIEELGLTDRLLPAADAAKRKFLLTRRGLQPIPTSPLGLLGSSLLGVCERARALAEPLVPRGGASVGEDETIAAFAARRFGAAVAERFAHPFVAGLFAGDADRLSAASALPALVNLERRHGSVLVGAVRARPAPAPLVSFPDGLEELPRALAASLGGDRVRLGVEVRAVRPALGPYRGEYRVTYAEGGRQDEIRCPAVAIAVPAHVAARLVAGFAPPVGRALGAIPYVPVAVVHAGWRRGGPAVDGYGFLVERDAGSRLLGASFASEIFANRAPDGGTLISARVGGARAPELLDLDDEALGRLVVEELHACLAARPPDFVRVVRHERALPQYTVGHRWRIAAIDDVERDNPGLVFAGSGYRGIGLADCLRQARDAAERVSVHLAEEQQRTRGSALAEPGQRRGAWASSNLAGGI